MKTKTEATTYNFGMEIAQAFAPITKKYIRLGLTQEQMVGIAGAYVPLIITLTPAPAKRRSWKRRAWKKGTKTQLKG